MKPKTGIMKFVAIIMVLVGVAVFTARAGAKDADSPLSVYVVNYPLQYFAERIGGPDVRVVFPVPTAGDPAFWKPLPEQIAAYQKRDPLCTPPISLSTKRLARIL